MNLELEVKLDKLRHANLNLHEKSFISNITALIQNGFDLTVAQIKALDLIVARKGEL